MRARPVRSCLVKGEWRNLLSSWRSARFGTRGKLSDTPSQRTPLEEASGTRLGALCRCLLCDTRHTIQAARITDSGEEDAKLLQLAAASAQ